MRASLRLFAVIILGLTAGACGGSTTQPENSRTRAAPATDGPTVAANKSAYAVFPDADAGADPSVPAAQGGRDQSIQLGEGPSDDKYRLEFARLESEGTPGTR